MFNSQYPLFGQGPVSVSLVKDVWGVYMGIFLQLSAIEFRAGSGASANDYFGTRAWLVADAVDEEYRLLRRQLMAALHTSEEQGEFSSMGASDCELLVTHPLPLLPQYDLNYSERSSLASDENIEVVTSMMLDYAVLFGFVLSVKDLVESCNDPVWGVSFRPSVISAGSSHNEG